MFEVLCSQRPRKLLMLEKKDRGRKGKDEKDPDVGKAIVRLREQADGRCRTYVIQALNPTKTELIGRFCTVVDMGYGEHRDLEILDAQEGLAGVTGDPAESGGPMDDELRVCLTALAYVIRKEFSSGISVIITGNLSEAAQTVKSMEL
ncbi:hypothetical protein BGZ88_009553 [Linnemannia elongata]|nr:hypothetical protein BGZ88_009553 [Linnemannia elongata]